MNTICIIFVVCTYNDTKIHTNRKIYLFCTKQKCTKMVQACTYKYKHGTHLYMHKKNVVHVCTYTHQRGTHIQIWYTFVHSKIDMVHICTKQIDK